MELKCLVQGLRKGQVFLKTLNHHPAPHFSNQPLSQACHGRKYFNTPAVGVKPSFILSAPSLQQCEPVELLPFLRTFIQQ